MWFASHLKYIFLIGMGFTFSLIILFLFENGKPVTASSEWNLHSQREYPFLRVWQVCIPWLNLEHARLIVWQRFPLISYCIRKKLNRYGQAWSLEIYNKYWKKNGKKHIEQDNLLRVSSQIPESNCMIKMFEVCTQHAKNWFHSVSNYWKKIHDFGTFSGLEKDCFHFPGFHDFSGLRI